MAHPSSLLWTARVALFALSLPLCHLASATVVFDNYRGQVNLGNSGAARAPNYNNNAGTNSIPNLQMLVAGGTDNIATSGTLPNIDWGTSAPELCNHFVNNAACTDQIQGRVVYALVQFPQAGSFTFAASHDDDLEVDFSTAFSASSAANYRNFDYNVPVGSLAAFTSESSYPAIPGSFVAPQASSCYVMRVYWNNRGGVNFLRMKWTRPDGTSEIIPAANLLDPSLPDSYANCANVPTDLGVKKTGPAQFTQNTASVSAKSTISYSVTVWNYGPTTTSNVIVSDLLPDNVTLQSSPTCVASGTAQCGTVSVNGKALLMTTGALPINSSAGNASTAPTQGSYLTYTLTVTPADGARSVNNTAAITVNDLNPDNNTSTVVSQSSGQVSISKSAPPKATVGVPFDYVLTVNNGYGTLASRIVVAERLPPTVTANSVTGANCGAMPSQPGALLTCTLTADIAAGASGSFTLNATASSVGVVTNYASVNPNGTSTPGTPGPNCDTTQYSCTSAKTQLSAPPVSLSKAFDPNDIGAGGTSLLTITVSNANSSVDLNGLSLTDDLPTNVTTTGVEVGNTCGGTFTSDGSTLTLKDGALAAGSDCQVQWMVTSTVPGPSYVNTIPANNVGSAEGATNPAPASDTLTVRVPANVDAKKTLLNVNGVPAQPNQKLRNFDVLEYVITVTNTGGQAGSTTLTEAVPNGAIYTGSNEGWSTSPACVAESSQCTQLVSVAANSSTTVHFTMTITPPVRTPTFINVVTSSSGDCNNCTYTSPGVVADMAATGGTPQTVTKGNTVTVVTSCTNNGPDYAVNGTCRVNGAPSNAVTTCVPQPPIAQFLPGAVIQCTTVFKAEQSGILQLVTVANSDTRDLNPRNNTAPTPITVNEPTPTDPANVPVDSRWMLVTLALWMLAAVGWKHRRK
ncbi:hypothetical protein G7047_26455 [Diaphorobacter sp. HDW4A]|uniref:DUF7933 domain-containing protein n=1 Tax=Diaphorobacter sp. HDW4A TaxID=2714924 RepID=UPI001409CD08|nr:DUF11 domain-containing protein [Diaphorobacter sp. HDW4A]QIL83088.1 hypothetical protein G7047_26455 [Diaphorobacter sp. HDW4A]